MHQVHETRLNIISETSRIEGKVIVDHVTRVHGIIKGDVEALPGSTLILCETSVLEGNVQAETLIVDGFIRGNVQAKVKVTLSRSSRVVGDIKAPSIVIEPGAYFEGRCLME